MSLLLIGAQSHRMDVVTAMKRLLPDESIVRLRDCLARGAPFVERVYPDADADEVAYTLRSVVAELQRMGVEPLLYVLPERSVSGDIPPEARRVSPDVFENRLRRYEEIRDEVDDLDKQGHE